MQLLARNGLAHIVGASCSGYKGVETGNRGPQKLPHNEIYQ